MRPARPVRHVLGVVLAAGALATGLAAPAAANPAAADLPTRALDVKRARAMVFADGRFFVSGDDVVRVLDTDGALLDTVGGLSGAVGEAASADGHRVYVALGDAHQIAAIDTGSLAVTRWTVDDCPTYLALAGDRLFFSGGCGSDDGTIASIDVTSGAVASSGVSDFFSGAPTLAIGGDVLAAAYSGSQPATILTYRIDGPALDRLGSHGGDGNANDLAVSPDGETVYVAPGAPYVLRRFSADLSTELTGMHTEPYPMAVAVSRDGTLVAAGVNNPNANLLVFTKGETEASKAGLANPAGAVGGATPRPHTLTFDAAGTTVSAIVSDGDRAWFTSSPAKDRVASELTLEAKQPTAPGGEATVTATLAGLADASVGFEITAGGQTSVVRATTDAEGRALLTQVFPAGAQVVAAYAGDADHEPARSDSVTVKDATRLTLGKVTSPSSRTGTFSTSATLTTPRQGVPITFTLDRPARKTVDVVVTTDAKGVAHLSQKVTSGGRVAASYPGDDSYQASRSAKGYWLVSSTTRASLSGKHKTKHHKLYYTKASRVFLDIAVDPSTAEQVHVALQQRSGSHWITKASSDEALDHGELTLQLDRAAKRKDLRFVVTFEGDRATRASKATTTTFRVG